MKIAITSTGNTVDSKLDQRFGRCAYFLIVDDDKLEAINNSAIASGGGAGIAAAQSVIDNKANVLITGNVGPNAFNTLQAAGIEVYMAQNGAITDILEQFKQGKLNKVGGANVGGHHGM